MQVVEVLQLIFDTHDARLPTLEDLVLCDLFRNIDLRELRGPSVSVNIQCSSFSYLRPMSVINFRI